MDTFTIKIKPLTPLWTGDANRKCTVLRETGILGSLRWWYEAVIRGLGGTACDPTNSECDGKNRCDVCELFGCAGWARKFRLEINAKMECVSEIEVGTREMRKVKGKDKYLKRTTGGFFTEQPIDLLFFPIGNNSVSETGLLNKTLEVIENFGALGARISQGNGVIKIVENGLPKKLPLKKFNRKNMQGQISLGDFWSITIRLEFSRSIDELINNFWLHQDGHKGFNDKQQYKNWHNLWGKYQYLPISFHIRDTIRHSEPKRNTRHDVFGTVGKGSKVFVSHGYKIEDKTDQVQIRIFGYGCDTVNIKKKLTESDISDKLFIRNNSYLKRVDKLSEIQGSDIIGRWLKETGQ